MAKRIVIGIWIVLAMFLGILLLADYSNNKMIESYKNGQIEQNQFGFLGFTQPYVNHYNRGNIYYTLGDFQRAVSEYEQALNSNPDAPEDCRIRVNYALALVKQINPATASENLEETLEILREARAILVEHECACEDSEDGHFTYAQRLKDEIDAYEWELLNPTATPTPTPTPTPDPSQPTATPDPSQPSPTPDPNQPSPTPDPNQPSPTPDPSQKPEPNTPTPSPDPDQPEPTQAPGDTATPTPNPEPTQAPGDTATPTPNPEPTQAPGDTATPTPNPEPTQGPDGTPTPAPTDPVGPVTPTPPQAPTPTMTPEEEILEIQRRAQNERHPNMVGDASDSNSYNWGSSACW